MGYTMLACLFLCAFPVILAVVAPIGAALLPAPVYCASVVAYVSPMVVPTRTRSERARLQPRDSRGRFVKVYP